MFRCGFVWAVVSAIAGQASYAGITLHLSPQALDAGVTVEVMISLSTDEPNIAVGAIGFDYDAKSEAWAALNPTAFRWVPEIMQDSEAWLMSETLPLPRAVAFFPDGAVALPMGEEVIIAALTVTPLSVGKFALASNITLFDANVFPLVVTGGDPTVFVSTFCPNCLVVDGDAADGGDGLLWNTAFNDLQDALAAALETEVPTEIWVAAGTYTPAGPNGDREASFLLLGDVAVYGGFKGGEFLRSQRNPAINVTVLSGDLNGDDFLATSMPSAYGRTMRRGKVGRNRADTIDVASLALSQTGAASASVVELLDDISLRAGFVDRPNGSRGRTLIPDTGAFAMAGSGLKKVVAGNDENSFHVVGTYATSDATVLDGFTITGGNADDTSFPNGWGGGVLNVEGDAQLIDCVIRDNAAQIGGAGMLSVGPNSPTLIGCTFEGNVSERFGGAAFMTSASGVAFRDCEFIENQAFEGGGGIVMTNGSPGTFSDCRFVTNQSGMGGGMLVAADSNLLVQSCEFTGNDANVGGAVFNHGNDGALFCDVQFRENTARAAGALYNVAASATLVSCSFSDNAATGGAGAHPMGGGILNHNGGNADISNCVFCGNSAQWGGALVNANSTVALANCTIANNPVEVFGSALFNLDSGSAGLENSIVWDTGINGIVDDDSSVTLVAFSDVQGGWPGEGNIDIAPEFVGAGCDNLRLDGVQPVVSPCIDAGNNALLATDSCDADNDGDFDEPLPFDIDGRDRVIDGFVDMGAFETP